MKIINWVKENNIVLMVAFMVILFFRQCGVSSDVSKMRKEIGYISEKTDKSSKSLDSLRNTLVSRDDIKNDMSKVMFEYLIFEDDLDKGKISLSDIKNRIKQ